MTAARLISLPVHGALEMLVGLALMVAPFLLGFGSAGIVASAVVGALIVGVALNGTATDHDAARISTLYAFDTSTVIGLLGGGLVLALAGDAPAGLTFAVAAVAQLSLLATTRYSRPA